MTARLAAALADRYRIERELGAGGMATVYLAEDLKHKRKVALKVMKPELAAVLGGERFLHEITVTATLQHPHILALFDSGSTDGFLYYVMPYVEGESLRERMDRERQLAIADVITITKTIASALDCAHRPPSRKVGTPTTQKPHTRIFQSSFMASPCDRQSKSQLQPRPRRFGSGSSCYARLRGSFSSSFQCHNVGHTFRSTS